MSVKTDASGRRSVHVETEVEGTPEEVWAAIATGPGITCWFVPTEGEERVGGTMTRHFGPGMDSAATITEWDPPHRYAAESAGFAPGMPAMATEWIVEARSGGSCVVRVVHSLFASTDEWDNQLESVENGWPSFFKSLRLYMHAFRGLRGATFTAFGASGGTGAEAWDAVARPLALVDATPGSRVSAKAPGFSGVVEEVGGDESPYQALVRLDEPAPGILFAGVLEMGSKAFVKASLYFYGDGAESTASEQQAVWQDWLAGRLASNA